MNIEIACVATSERRLRTDPAYNVTQHYVARAAVYEPCCVEVFLSEAALLASISRRVTRTSAFVILLDSSGRSVTSEEFAAQLGRLRDAGQQEVLACIGPASGWTAAGRARANQLLSLGPLTLPHALAQAVLAEQIYRALTILAGHPYHCGH